MIGESRWKCSFYLFWKPLQFANGEAIPFEPIFELTTLSSKKKTFCWWISIFFLSNDHFYYDNYFFTFVVATFSRRWQYRLFILPAHSFSSHDVSKNQTTLRSVFQGYRVYPFRFSPILQVGIKNKAASSQLNWRHHFYCLIFDVSAIKTQVSSSHRLPIFLQPSSIYVVILHPLYVEEEAREKLTFAQEKKGICPRYTRINCINNKKTYFLDDSF